MSLESVDIVNKPVVFFENRMLDLAISDKEIIASDQKRLIVNAFAKFQIVDLFNNEYLEFKYDHVKLYHAFYVVSDNGIDSIYDYGNNLLVDSGKYEIEESFSEVNSMEGYLVYNSNILQSHTISLEECYIPLLPFHIHL